MKDYKMKNYLLLALISLLPLQAKAITMEIFDKSGQKLFNVQSPQDIPASLGKITIDIFENMEVPYQGSDLGISEIYGIGSSLEMISNTEMKAYGWCFAIDGHTPETLTHETEIKDQNTYIEWYYAYAHYKDGKWIGQCIRPGKQSR